ncbi:MAG: tRNA (N6-isopentenyl adenosine(37)-C2)-methylthiotransferase MiaB, partial [Verrucomicrobia bacterium]
LLDLLSRSSRGRNTSLIGTVQEVLVEGPSKRRDRYTGRTRGNRTVHFDATERLVGSLVPVKIERATTSSLYGAVQLLGVAERQPLGV